MKVILSIAITYFTTLFKIYLLRGTTSYVPDTQPMDDGPRIAEQQDDIVICETPEQTTDELGNNGNDRSIEDKQMQS